MFGNWTSVVENDWFIINYFGVAPNTAVFFTVLFRWVLLLFFFFFFFDTSQRLSSTKKTEKQCHYTVPTTFYYFLKIVPCVQENAFQYRKHPVRYPMGMSYIEKCYGVFVFLFFLTLDQPLFIVAFHFIKKEQLGCFTQGTGKWVV